MNNSFTPYERRYTPTFEKQLVKLQRKDHIRFEQVTKTIEEIRQAPCRNIDFMKGVYRGKREWRAGDDRVIFVVCKQCREEGHIRFNGCSDCSQTKDETVVYVKIVEGHNY
jgi:mRNA-degrading endonuclease RelE of RelBE toxin-antitoxin system